MSDATGRAAAARPGGGMGSVPTHRPALSANAEILLRLRYLRRDPGRNVVETPADLVTRVAWAVAQADGLYGPRADVTAAAVQFASAIARLDFLPNSPLLMNAGLPPGQLMACFVLPVEDSLDGIFAALKSMALIQQAAGGTGFSFSRLRPRGDTVSSTRGTSSGPVSFIGVFDRATDVITTGGLRRGANMGVLRVDHPDVREFVHAKENLDALPTFNLSVALTDAFMDSVERRTAHPLVNSRTDAVVGAVDAHELLSEIARLAWQNGQPGVLFLDRINRDNVTPHLGQIEATNPCSEQPLLPYEACCLGSINLAHMVRPAGGQPAIDERRLRHTVRVGVHFLDNAIDVNRYLLPETEELCLTNRKIGLGVMGFADLLVCMGIPYGSEDAVRLAHEVMGLIQREAIAESEALAERRGPFPSFGKSTLAEQGARARRNATLTTVAPTGSLSILANCSAGIEPLYALAYERELADGVRLSFIHPAVADLAAKEAIPVDAALGLLGERSPRFPDSVHEILATSLAIPPEWHLRVQAAFQEHVDAGISKTLNLPRDEPPESIERIIREAHRLGCKGVTVFRDESRAGQPLHVAGLCLACDAPPTRA